MNAQEKNERRLDDWPNEMSHELMKEADDALSYLTFESDASLSNYCASLKQGRLAASLPSLFLHLLCDPAIIWPSHHDLAIMT